MAIHTDRSIGETPDIRGPARVPSLGEPSNLPGHPDQISSPRL